MKNGYWLIREILGFGNLIFDLGFSNEVVGGGKTVKRYLFAVVELWVDGWVVALVILLLTKVHMFGFLDFRLLIWTSVLTKRKT